MSAGVASLLFIVGGLVVLALELLFPFRAGEAFDDVERGSTTIKPEDR